MYNSDFCDVHYDEQCNIAFVKWKSFCCGEDYRILIMPDHPTPLETKTHSSAAVPYLIYDSSDKKSGVESFTEQAAESTGNYVEHGPDIMEKLLKKM